MTTKRKRPGTRRPRKKQTPVKVNFQGVIYRKPPVGGFVVGGVFGMHQDYDYDDPLEWDSIHGVYGVSDD